MTIRKAAAPSMITITTPAQTQSRGIIICAPSPAGYGHHTSDRGDLFSFKFSM